MGYLYRQAARPTLALRPRRGKNVAIWDGHRGTCSSARKRRPAACSTGGGPTDARAGADGRASVRAGGTPFAGACCPGLNRTESEAARLPHRLQTSIILVMFRIARRLAERWPARLLVVLLACGLLAATAPQLLVHSHANATDGHHHEADGGRDAPSPESADAGSTHAHDAGGIAAPIPAPPAAPDRAPASDLLPTFRVAAVPATPPDFPQRPPIA